MVNSESKINWATKLSYGSGNLLGSGALAISGTWLLYFYTSFCGLSAIEATLIFATATYLDVILNPIMGFVTDNFYQTKIGKKFGRRRFFILLGIPLMVCYPLMWVDNMSFLYYLSTYVLFEVIYTSIMIPYETLPVEMTNSFSERSYLTGWKAMFGKMANFLAQAIPWFYFLFYDKNSPTPFLLTGITYAVIMAISMLFLYINSWERPFSEVKEEKIESFTKAVKKLVIDIFSTIRVKTFRNHLGMYLFGFGAEWLFAATFTYYIIFVLHEPRSFVSEINSLSSICQLISTAIFMAICAKKGFRGPFAIALLMVITSVIAYVAIYKFGVSENLTYIVIAVTIWFGFGTGGVYYIPWNVYTFLADVDEVVTGRRREGVYAGAMTMAGKLMRASVVFILGIVLTTHGFEKGTDIQPQSAVNAITGVLLYGVVGLALLGVFFSWKMKLNHKSHSIVIAEIKRIKEGGSKDDVTPETKQVLEELTGFRYEQCFGNNNVGYKD